MIYVNAVFVMRIRIRFRINLMRIRIRCRINMTRIHITVYYYCTNIAELRDPERQEEPELLLDGEAYRYRATGAGAILSSPHYTGGRL